MHMYKVAAVAYLISDNFKEDIDKENIVAADLLHDMGNIIKFNLELFPEFLEPEGYSFWENVQKEYINKYGDDEHIATTRIAKEININHRISELLESVGASRTKIILKSKDKAKWIANYADYRVAPNGIVTLQERLKDGRRRYLGNKGHHSVTLRKSHEIEKYSRILEKRIQKMTSIDLNTIEDGTVSNIIEELHNFNIDTQ